MPADKKARKKGKQKKKDTEKDDENMYREPQNIDDDVTDQIEVPEKVTIDPIDRDEDQDPGSDVNFEQDTVQQGEEQATEEDIDRLANEAAELALGEIGRDESELGSDDSDGATLVNTVAQKGGKKKVPKKKHGSVPTNIEILAQEAENASPDTTSPDRDPINKEKATKKKKITKKQDQHLLLEDKEKATVPPIEKARASKRFYNTFPKIPYEQLAQSAEEVPVGVDLQNKETHLEKSEFEDVFGMTYAAYYGLSPNSKRNLKSDKRLM